MITPKEFADKMREYDKSNDPEMKHVHADDLMCEVLRELGYEEGVEIFEEMYIWYS